MSQLNILWHSVSPFIRSGYGKVTRNVTTRLAQYGFNVVVSAYYGLEPGGVVQYQGVTVVAAKDGPFGIQSAAKYARMFNTHIQLLHTDWWAFCFTADTEVLTPSGWRSYKSISEGDLVATFNTRTGYIEFQPVIRKQVYDSYLNRLYHVKARMLDFIYTEGHSIVCKWASGCWRLKPIESFNTNAWITVPLSAEASVNKPLGLTRELSWLIGFTLSRGEARNSIIQYSISIEYLDVILKLRETLNALGLEYSERELKTPSRFRIGPDTIIQFTIKRSALSKWFKSLDSKLPIKELLFCSRDEFAWLIEGLRDGCTSSFGRSFVLSVNSRQLADYIQALCVLHGFSCRIKAKGQKLTLTISDRNTACFNHSHIQLVNSSSKPIVWGLQVANGTVVVRRNGLHCITGNSAFPDLMPYPVLYSPMDHYDYPEEIMAFTRKYKRIIALCNWQHEELKKKGLDSVVIPHGVETALFKPMDKNACKRAVGLEGKFVFGTVAANNDKEDRKAHTRMIKAMYWFLENNPDARRDIAWLYHTVPDAPAGYRLDLVARKWGLSDIIRFMDPAYSDIFLSEEQLAVLYNAMDVHLLCSKREGFGLPILESMSCGVPNIVHDASSMTELVKGRGWLVKSLGTDLNAETTPLNAETRFPDVYDIADKIAEAYFKPDLRSKYAAECRRFALQFDWNTLVATKWVPLLDEIHDEILAGSGFNIIQSELEEALKKRG